MSNITLLDQHQTAELVGRICKGSKTLESDINQAGCSILVHIRDHGNYTAALQLLNGLARGVRVKGLAEWFKGMSNGKFAPGLNPKTGQWQAELSKDRTEADFDIETAMATSFADYTVERDPVTLTVDKLIKGLKRTATNTGTFSGTTIPKVNEDARVLAMKIVQFVQTQQKAA